MTAPKMNRDIRNKIIEELKERDGYRCFFPGCQKPFTKSNPPTIDHWLPWSVGFDSSIDNLRLMHRDCNNKKGNTVPNNDGSLTFTKKKHIKVPRPEICEECFSGRILLIGETCWSCGSGPQPKKFPTAYKKKPANCSHSGRDHCWWCFLGFIKRRDLVE